eukprot:5602796-Pleurochrysis_carterae.AAC.1
MKSVDGKRDGCAADRMPLLRAEDPAHYAVQHHRRNLKRERIFNVVIHACETMSARTSKSLAVSRSRAARARRQASRTILRVSNRQIGKQRVIGRNAHDSRKRAMAMKRREAALTIVRGFALGNSARKQA